MGEMGATPSKALSPKMPRAVTINVTNKFGNSTLESPRIYLPHGRCSVPPDPEVPGGSSTTCEFSSSSSPGCSGVLIYRTNTCTLTIYFSNPLEDDTSPRELALELSPAKRERHRGKLEDIYEEMSRRDVGPSTGTTSFDRIAPDTRLETAEVTLDHVKAMATMSNARHAVVNLLVKDTRSR